MKIIKFTVITLLSAALILLLIALILIKTFDSNLFKNAAEDFVYRETGRHLKIGGDISISFKPFLLINIRNIMFENASGFSPENMLEIDNLTVGLRLLPLIKRNVEINGISADGLRMTYSIGPDGTSNIDDIKQFITQNKDRNDAKPEKKERSAFQVNLEDTTIRTLDMSNSYVHIEDQRSGRSIEFQNINIDTGLLAPGIPATIDVSTYVHGVNPDFNASINIKNVLVASLTKVYLRSANLDINYNFVNPHIDGSIQFTTNGTYTMSTGILEMNDMHLISTVDKLIYGTIDMSGVTDISMTGSYNNMEKKLSAVSNSFRFESTGDIGRLTNINFNSQAAFSIDFNAGTSMLKIQSKHNASINSQLRDMDHNYSATLDFGYVFSYNAFSSLFSLEVDELSLHNLTHIPGSFVSETDFKGAANITYSNKEHLLNVKKLTLSSSAPQAKIGQRDYNMSAEADIEGFYKIDDAQAFLSKLNLTYTGSTEGMNLNLNLMSQAGYDVSKKYLTLDNATLKGNVDMSEIKPAIKASIDTKLDGSYNIDNSSIFLDNASGGFTAVIDNTSTAGNIALHAFINPATKYFDLKEFVLDGTAKGPDIPGGSQPVHAEGSVLLNLLGELLDVRYMKLKTYELDASLTGTAEHIRTKPEYTFTLTTGKFSPRVVLKHLGLSSYLERFDDKVFNSATLNATLSYKDGVHTLPASFIIDDTKGRTNLKLDRSGEKPYIEASFNLDRIDVPSYIPKPGSEKKQEPQAVDTYIYMTSSYDQPTITIPELDFTAYPNIKIQLSANRITARAIVLSNVSLIANMDNGSLTVADFSGKGMGGSFKFAAFADGSKQHKGLALKGGVDNISIQPVAKSFGFDYIIFPLNTSFSIDSNFADHVFTITDFKIKSDNLNATLTMEANLRRKPIVSFNLNAEDINLEHYIKTNEQQAEPKQTKQSAAPTKQYTFADWPGSINGKITVGTLIYKKFPAEKIICDIRIENGTMSIRSNLNAYGGTMDGNITAKGDVSDPELSAVYNLNGIRAETFLRQATGTDNPFMSGTLSSHATMTTRGMLVEDILQNLDGTASYYIRDAVLHGIGYDPNLLSLDNVRGFLLLGDEKRTPINNVNGTFTVTKGVLNLEPVTLISKNITLNIGGMMDLNTMIMDFGGSVSLSDYADAKLTITGSTSKPDLYIDQSALRNGLLLQITSNTGRGIISTPMNLLEGITNTVEKGLDSLLPKDLQ